MKGYVWACSYRLVSPRVTSITEHVGIAPLRGVRPDRQGALAVDRHTVKNP